MEKRDGKRERENGAAMKKKWEKENKSRRKGASKQGNKRSQRAKGELEEESSVTKKVFKFMKEFEMELWRKISLFFPLGKSQTLCRSWKSTMLEGSYDDGDEFDAAELAPFSKWRDL